MFDGLVGSIAGALAGGVVSLLIARLVLDRTRRDNEELAREQASLEAARHLSLGLRRLCGSLEGLRHCSGPEVRRRCTEAAETFELEVVDHAPALTNAGLRTAVEGVSGVLLNFSHFIACLEVRRDAWTAPAIEADVQCADFVWLLSETFVSYRQGGTLEIPAKPGWAQRQGQWRWAIPPGMWVDGSGHPEPGWTKHTDDDEREYWLQSGAE